MSDFVLDASAILAILNREPGWETAAELVTPGCFVSTVNLSEVVAKLRERGVSESDIEVELAGMDLEVILFSHAQAMDAGFLRPSTIAGGLSLGDRACLALARDLRLPALTGDGAWRAVDVGVEIRLFR
ncbi:MAG: type II toxin-antitoxin system VapC family toxin [Dehalococcoidia bacterium]